MPGQAAHTGVERVSVGIYGYIPGHSNEYQKFKRAQASPCFYLWLEGKGTS